MPKKTDSAERCVHCLRVPESATADHVPPRSWYPDTTPPEMQRWTVPSCPECNSELGKLERDLLIRLSLCIDPASPEASGLASKALRSLGLDADDLSEEEKAHRDKLRAKIRSELLPYADVANGAGVIPGLTQETSSEAPQFALPIPWAGLSIIAEKMARGCEYKLKKRYVELPYGIRTFIADPRVRSPLFSHPSAKLIDLGPGCKVTRVFATEDRNVVRYQILVWGTLCFRVNIDLEDELRRAEPTFSRPQGIMPPDDHGKMLISPYLRLVR